MLERICSGGQTGVDQAGLRAAKKWGLKTGGWMPKGWRTLMGARPEFATLYDMKEHADSGYPARTEDNVRDSDGTIRIAKKWSSPGERCTLGAIKWLNKPHVNIDFPDEGTLAGMVARWIRDNNIRTLNVAGNAEETAPGIGEFAEQFLLEVFVELSKMGLIKEQVNDRVPEEVSPACLEGEPDGHQGGQGQAGDTH